MTRPLPAPADLLDDQIEIGNVVVNVEVSCFAAFMLGMKRDDIDRLREIGIIIAGHAVSLAAAATIPGDRFVALYRKADEALDAIMTYRALPPLVVDDPLARLTVTFGDLAAIAGAVVAGMTDGTERNGADEVKMAYAMRYLHAMLAEVLVARGMLDTDDPPPGYVIDLMNHGIHRHNERILARRHAAGGAPA